MKFKFLVFPITAVFSFFLLACQNKDNDEPDDQNTTQDTTAPKPKKNIQYGFDFNQYQVITDTVQSNWTLSHLLLPYKVDQYSINQAAQMAADSTVGLKYINKGDPFFVLAAKGDTSKKAQYVIYVDNIIDYYVFDFTDTLGVSKKQKPITVEERTIAGEIVQNSNLTLSINQQTKDINITGSIAENVAGILAWSIDFFKLHPGDHYKVIYELKSVDGKPYGIGDIKALYFNHQDDPYYAFRYMTDSLNKSIGYYNDSAKEMKRPFLMSPVKFSRVSSGYTKRRFHPVQKRWKAHLGTDYAAPHGTPILATADGNVIAATYSRFNGNYVKIKHNDTYTTQYLHMSGFAEGVRRGTHVRQGEVIGYIGSTGLATGPHVCYRFWKNGKQVNHRALKFPNSEPMKKELIPDYMEYIAPIKKQLDQMEITPYKKDNENEKDAI